MSDKTAVREFYLSRRKGFKPTAVDAEHIAENVKQVLTDPSGTCCTYISCNSEVDPSPLTEKLYEWTFAYPRVEDDKLTFFTGMRVENFIRGRFGIPEPDPSQAIPVPLQTCKAVLVPGVAFDRRGGRLGMGMGFYDRALAEFNGLKIGLAYSCQIAEQDLPVEEHDVFMDVVVTEKLIIKPLGVRKASWK